MEIELITTKKKLTASILNQMFSPTLEEMRHIRCLGIVNIKSFKTPKLLLITEKNKYRILSMGWKKCENRKICRKTRRGSVVKTFKSDKEAEDFLAIYNKIIKSNPEQIFI
jgi:hypothetical protein